MNPQPRSRTILLVDDDDDIREVVSEVLTIRGYTVVAVANGLQALEWLEGREEVCVILLDLMMPQMDGWEFRAHQLRDPEIASIPVVVLTGAGPTAATTDSLDAAQVLLKPVDLATLTQAIARYC